MSVKNFDELYVEELRDLYSAEKQLVAALPKVAKSVTDPKLQKAVEEHLDVGEVAQGDNSDHRVGRRHCDGLAVRSTHPIGHDIDRPLLDLVADRRASTPTDAAALVVPDAQAEYAAVLAALQDPRTVPPVAVLSVDGSRAGFYPLAEFSPEWVALR
mgnify:CR=1 FL=1